MLCWSGTIRFRFMVWRLSPSGRLCITLFIAGAFAYLVTSQLLLWLTRGLVAFASAESALLIAGLLSYPSLFLMFFLAFLASYSRRAQRLCGLISVIALAGWWL